MTDSNIQQTPRLPDALVFVCDEAACHVDPMFYEIFTMDDRWDIIRAILMAAALAHTRPELCTPGEDK